MDAQQIMMDSRLLHVRELKTRVERLRAENAALRARCETLESHFALALLAADDLASLAPEGRLWIVDGWNLILGANRRAHDRRALIAAVEAFLVSRPDDRAWIVFDGHRPASAVRGRLRVTYTGGTGPHRADRFICDYLRLAGYRDELTRLTVVTADRDFAKEASRLGVRCRQGLESGEQA